MPDLPTLTIAVISYNTRELLARCLVSLAAHPPSCNHEVVVVDNASPDGSAAWMREQRPDVKLLALPENRGYAAAVNAAIAAVAPSVASSPFPSPPPPPSTSPSPTPRPGFPHLLVLNADVEATAGAIDRLLAALESSPRIGMAGPRQVEADGRIQISWGRFPGLWSEWRRRRDQRARDSGDPAALARLEQYARQGGRVDWLAGSAVLVRNEVLKDVGGMDEGYFLYFEDIDWCRRAALKGWECRLEGEALFIHHRGKAMATDPSAARRAYAESRERYWRTHLDGWRAAAMKVWQATRSAL